MFLIPETRYAIRNTKKYGRGAFAKRDIAAGTVIGDYLGILVRPSDENEKKNGLYQMSGGDRYDMLPDPRSNGIHLINDSCVHNCGMYPFKGHVLYVALRTIFKGEEITIGYDIDDSCKGGANCRMHECRCGSALCVGTMHDHSDDSVSRSWESLKKKAFGPYYGSKIPGRYGKPLAPLSRYPSSVRDHPEIWDIFGSETKPPLRCSEKTLPSLKELRARIRTSGRQIVFPALRVRILGITGGLLVARSQ